MRGRAERTAWVSYLRVSTPEQADRELSLPAQRHPVQEYAHRHGATIAREYVEAGCSGSHPQRPAFRRMLEDVFRPGSDVAAIVVNHTSRFTRDAAEARVVKGKLRRIGVRVLSVCQDLAEDPMGKLMEGVFECFDQYESELNGVQTSAAMTEAVRQGFFPGGRAPIGYRLEKVEPRRGVPRHIMVPDEAYAPLVREVFQLYITRSGAKAVARELNQRGLLYRTGVPWTKDLVLNVIAESAVVGTYWWGRRRANRPRPSGEWSPLKVEPIVDADVFELANQLRASRERARAAGRASAKPHLLSGLLHCGRCGASYQLETSGKRIDGTVYRYCYYNCRSFCRSGREVCPGHRIATERLDAALMAHIADRVCRDDRVLRLRRLLGGELASSSVQDLAAAWRSLITADSDVARGYVLHLFERIEVHGRRIVVTARTRSPPSSVGESWHHAVDLNGTKTATASEEESPSSRRVGFLLLPKTRAPRL